MPKKFFIILLLAGLLSGCVTIPPTTREEANLKELCDRHGIHLEWDTVSQVITLTRDNFKATGLVGSDVVIIGKEKIFLSSPIQRVNNVIVAPADFEAKVLQRFTEVTAFSIPRFRKIVLDAGHGGKDPGAQGKSGVKEKYVVLDIAKRLKRNLIKEGFQVIMTRDRDEFVSLEKRTETATRFKADLFLSIHANANRARSVEGFEVYYAGDMRTKDLTEEQRLKNQEAFFERLAMRKKSPVLEKILLDMMYVHKQTESKTLARRLAKIASRHVETRDGGEHAARFFVLRNTLIPAILIEVGYLSNSREEKLLQTAGYRQRLADAISEGLVDYGQ